MRELKNLRLATDVHDFIQRLIDKKLKRISGSLPKGFGKSEELNKELLRQMRLAEDIISYALIKKIPDPVQFVKLTFKHDFKITELEKAVKKNVVVEPKINKDFFFQFDDYIKSKEKSVASATVRVFKNLKIILQTFQTYRKKLITFDDIDLNFYEEFLDYLSFEHIHQNKKAVLKGLKTNRSPSCRKKGSQCMPAVINNTIDSLQADGLMIKEVLADTGYSSGEALKALEDENITGYIPNFGQCKRDLMLLPRLQY